MVLLDLLDLVPSVGQAADGFAPGVPPQLDSFSPEGRLSDPGQVIHPTVLVNDGHTAPRFVTPSDVLAVKDELQLVWVIEPLACLVIDNRKRASSAENQVRDAEARRQSPSERQREGFLDANDFPTLLGVLRSKPNRILQLNRWVLYASPQEAEQVGLVRRIASRQTAVHAGRRLVKSLPVDKKSRVVGAAFFVPRTPAGTDSSRTRRRQVWRN